MTDNHARLSPALVETIAGLSAGTASTLAAHPLDVIKTRLQVQKQTLGSSTSSISVIRSLLQSQSPVASLYRGLVPNLLGNASSWALFFYFKSIAESQIRAFRTPTNRLFVDNDDFIGKGVDARLPQLSPLDYFVSSAASGILITLCTNPIWVLKTRMLSTTRGAKNAYPSMLAGATLVWKNEGIRGFYRGVGISMLGVSHGAVQFAVYEPLKTAWSTYFASRDGSVVDAPKGRMSNASTLVVSGTAKIIAGTVTYPHQVIRSRMQTQDAEKRFGKGIRGVVGNVWKDEGMKGFYRGVGPNVVRVLPATWVTFLVYENVRWAL